MKESTLSLETKKQVIKFIDRLCQGMKEPREEIQDFREEMTTHLLISVEELIRQGETEELALKIAMNRFGELHSVKEELRQLYRIKHSFLVSILRAGLAMLLVAGLIYGVLLKGWDESIYDKYAKDVYEIAQKEITPRMKVSEDFHVEISEDSQREMIENLQVKMAAWVKQHWGVEGIAISRVFTSTNQNPSIFTYGKDEKIAWALNHFINPEFRPGESIVYHFPNSSYLIPVLVHTYGGYQYTNEINPSKHFFTVQVAMKYFNYTFFNTLVLCLLVGYWLMFTLWACMNAYYDRLGNLYWVILFITLHVIGYLIYMIYKRQKKNVNGLPHPLAA